MRGTAPLLLGAGAFGCAGPQSALAPAGDAAAEIATLWWWMAAGAVVIWLAVLGLTVYAVWIRPDRHGAKAARRLIVGGGVVVPILVLLIVLVWGLSLLPRLLAAAPADALHVRVTGKQFWWRVEYAAAPNVVSGIVLANELHLPAGRAVALQLDSSDVIHSLWIPSLAGKVDMIPGRTTRLVLHPRRPGIFRGACAEYCGVSHAHMRLFVIVETPQEFARWLEAQAQPALRPQPGTTAARGETFFHDYGCGACHTVRGTTAAGTIGPDLTHVGSRASIAAGRLPNDEASFARWLVDTHRLKPGAFMPQFSMLPADERIALAAFLEALQ